MRIGALTRLVAALEFHQLQELARRYLAQVGFRNPVVVDGWRDGGVDVRVYTVDGSTSSIAVQTSVEWDWKSKLVEDVDKVIENYGSGTFIYVSTRRIPELDFARIRVEYAKKSVSLEKVDAQVLASTFYQADSGRSILEIAEIVEASRPVPAPRRRLEEQAAYSFLFLSDDTQGFRKAMLQQVIEGRLREGSCARSSLIEEVQAAVHLSDGQAVQIASQVDSMLTRGLLRSTSGIVSLSDERKAVGDLEASVVDAAWIELESRLVEVVRAEVPRSRRSDVSGAALLPVVGAALALAPEISSEDISPALYADVALRPQLRARLSELTALLTEWGIAGADKRREALDKIIEAAADSHVAAALTAAELFLAINSLQSSHLALAFGQESVPSVVLDTSVAMPMLLSLMYSPEGRADFIAAKALYGQSSNHGVTLVLPGEYLEEAAAHLVDAWTRYRALLGAVPELVDSTNAYVAHFARLKGRGLVEQFEGYVEGLGVSAHIVVEDTDYYQKIRVVERQLSASFRSYGIDVRSKGSGSYPALRATEEEIRSLAKRTVPRGDVTIAHDARVVALLDAVSDTESVIFCTHDRMLFELQRSTGRGWHVLRPGAVADLLSLVRSDDDDSAPGNFVAPSAWPRFILDEERRGAAEIWDWLAKNHGDDVQDAKRVVEIRAFVAKFVAGGWPVVPDAIEKAWREWRESESDPKETAGHSKATGSPT